MDFQNKKIIVTGASRSIGQRIALSFAEQGADVVVSYRSDEHGAQATVTSIQTLGRRAQAIYADFTNMDDISAFARQAIAFLGHVDILINNAGMSCRETFFDLSLERMQQAFQVNTLAPLHLTQLCAKDMVEKNIQGCIINISSIAGTYTFPRGIGYGASKAALNKWTKHAALDLAKFNIRVNAIAPGVIQAGMNETTEQTNPEFWRYALNSIPLQRAGTPHDIAQMALYLASDKANWITGKVFEIDGGHVL